MKSGTNLMAWEHSPAGGGHARTSATDFKMPPL